MDSRIHGLHAIMGLPQEMLSPIHAGDHMLDLFFSTKELQHVLNMENITISFLLWSENFLVICSSLHHQNLCKGTEPVKIYFKY